jgi:hypothetical protein
VRIEQLRFWFVEISIAVGDPFYMISSRIDIGDISLIAFALLVFTYIPVYYANFSYAFISKKIWEKHA